MISIPMIKIATAMHFLHTPIDTGVAILKITYGVKLTRNPKFAGWQFANHTAIGTSDGVIMKFRNDGQYTDPFMLRDKKVFYRFYYEDDKNGKQRAYAYFRYSSDDEGPYYGKRVIAIGLKNLYLLIEPSKRIAPSNPEQNP